MSDTPFKQNRRIDMTSLGVKGENTHQYSIENVAPLGNIHEEEMSRGRTDALTSEYY